MPFGIIEVIALLLGLSGFGLQNNPKAPTPDAALEYAMPDPDVVAHFDAGAVIPGNYKVLLGLADQPQIKQSPELVKMVKQMINEVEGARGLAKTMSGIDFTTDISDATVFLRVIRGAKNPEMVLEVHGKFPVAILDKLGKMGGKAPAKVGTGTLVEMGPDTPALAITGSGVLLVGQSALLRDRLAATWKAPSHAPGTSLGYIADILAQKPVFALSLTLSSSARTEIAAKFDHPNFLTDVVARHKVAAFAIYHDGLGMVWGDSTKQGLDDMAQTMDGFVDVLRAAQIAPRGIAKIFLGALDSYKGDKQIDELIRHKADLIKIMDSYSGDGNFKVQRDVDAKNLKITMRLTGKTLSEVVPLGALAPLAGIGMFVGVRKKSESTAPVMAPPMRSPSPAPSKTRGPTKKSGDPCEGGQ